MFDGPTCKIVSKNNNVAAKGTRNGNLYILQGLSVIDETVECANVAKVESRDVRCWASVSRPHWRQSSRQDVNRRVCQRCEFQ